jgi:hypothetical protein
VEPDAPGAPDLTADVLEPLRNRQFFTTTLWLHVEEQAD